MGDGAFVWSEASIEAKLEHLYQHLHLLVAFVDEHEHTESGFPCTREGVYSKLKGDF